MSLLFGTKSLIPFLSNTNFSLSVLQMIWTQQDLCSLNAKWASVDVLYDSLIMAFPGARLHCTIEPPSGSVVTERSRPPQVRIHDTYRVSKWVLKCSVLLFASS